VKLRKPYSTTSAKTAGCLSAKRKGDSSTSSGPSGKVARPRAALDAGGTPGRAGVVRFAGVVGRCSDIRWDLRFKQKLFGLGPVQPQNWSKCLSIPNFDREVLATDSGDAQAVG
jgi:hypothetical protein